MQRLVSQFGSQFYSEERIKLFYNEVSSLDAASWRAIVDRFIAEFRHAPILPEIREAISLEREKRWATEKRQHQKDAEDFFHTRYSNGEKGHIAETIKNRIMDKMDDSRWEKFMSDLERSAEPTSNQWIAPTPQVQ